MANKKEKFFPEFAKKVKLEEKCLIVVINIPKEEERRKSEKKLFFPQQLLKIAENRQLCNEN
jgi:hypothetical protein